MTARPATTRYVLITIVRDEAAFLERTIASVERQRILPAAWLVVDDGSVDDTPGILQRAARRLPWLEVDTRSRREARSPGEAVTEGFNRMLPRAMELDPQAVVKLDGDMEFEPDYFQRLLAALDDDPQLGIVGGRAMEPRADGSWGLLYIPSFHVHGATKMYRRECLDHLGGLSPGLGWDTVDIIRARLAGWTTRSLPDVRFRHLRVIGTAAGALRGHWFRGLAAYRSGYHPFFALLRAGRHLFRKPYGLSGAAFFNGFTYGYRRKVPRALDSEEIKAFRREQWKALTGQPSWWR